MDETVFLLAGFSTSRTALSTDYSEIRKGLSAKGYKLVPVDISWRQKTPSVYAKEFIQLYNKNKSDRNIIIGNSFGALVAFISIAEIKPDVVYLCSLSPFFKEDEKRLPDDEVIKYFGIRRMNDLRTYSCSQIAKLINKTSTKIYVLYGEKELITSPPLVNRSKEVAQAINGTTLLEIPNAPHNLSDKIYYSAVLDMV